MTSAILVSVCGQLPVLGGECRGRRSKCSTRRPRWERKADPSIDSQANLFLSARRRPITTRHSASVSGPSGKIRLPSSAAHSHASRNLARDHHDITCHHNMTQTASARHIQSASPAARCATSCASTARCWRWSYCAENVTGNTIVGWRTPNVAGVGNESDSMTRSRRRTPNCDANCGRDSGQRGLPTGCDLRVSSQSRSRRQPSRQVIATQPVHHTASNHISHRRAIALLAGPVAAGSAVRTATEESKTSPGWASDTGRLDCDGTGSVLDRGRAVLSLNGGRAGG